MPDAPYVYLHDINGNPIKPVTDLAALNVTTTNGIHIEPVNGGTIGIRDGYIQSSYYLSMMDTQAGPARQDEEAFVSGGTMYTLLGGYAVTSDVPPATAASEYRVPSEKAVREAIDAYVATGGSDIVAGKGIDMGGGQINATEATVEETLKGYTVSGGTTTVPFDDQVVMPYDLRGALSLGQAVDVSCPVLYHNGVGYFTFTGDSTHYTAASDKYKQNYLEPCSYHIDSVTTTSGDYYFGFLNNSFPKFAPGLKYLVIADIRNSGAALSQFKIYADATYFINTLKNSLTGAELQAGQTDYTRLARVCTSQTFYFSGKAAALNTALTIDIKNFRIYEVTALTDEAILALATAEDPDAWFRSNARSVNERYLVKPDMVSPWIPIIRMSTNSTALTVGAGLAYAVDVFGGSYTIGVDTFPEDAYGQDAHLELFVKAGSHVTFQPPLSLMDPLTENAGHNITIKFREGRATAHVDDTNYGYIINVPEGTAGTQAGGSLYFAISGSTSNYAIFAAQLDGSTVTTPSVTANKDITIMGNGTDKTFISGTFGAASGKQLIMRELALTNSTVSTVGYTDLNTVAIPSGSTVALAPSSVYTLRCVDLILDGVFDCGSYHLGEGIAVPVSIQGSGTLNFTSGGVWPSVGGSTLSGVYVHKTAGAVADMAVGNFLRSGALINCLVQNDTGCGTHFNEIEGSTIYGAGSYGALSPWNNVSYTIKESYLFGTVGIMITATGKPDPVVINISGSTFNRIGIWDVTRSETIINLGGYNKSLNYIGGDAGSNTCMTVNFADNSTFDFEDCDGSVISVQAKQINLGNNVTFKTRDGSTGLIDNLSFTTWMASGLITTTTAVGTLTITIPTTLWSANNVVFGQQLDASAATTVQLTGTTFTSGSQIAKSPSQIQLPANSINSFSGNTTAAGTKILKAGTIIVGDDRTNPTGSATIEFVGGSTALSGIGTYIAKDGTNDFVPIAGNVTSVTTATGTGAGSLQYALTSGTKYAKLANNLVASATFTAATNVVNKNIVTSEYQKVLGGNYSFTDGGGSLIVDEAEKTVNIVATDNNTIIRLYDVEVPTGATLKYVSGTQRATKVSGGGTLEEWAIPVTSGGSLVIDGCTMKSNQRSWPVYVFSGAAASMNNCIVSGYQKGLTVAAGGVMSATNCEFINSADLCPCGDVTGHLTMVDCQMHNTATNIYGGIGQGLYIGGDSGHVTFKGCTIQDTFLSSGCTVTLSGYNKLEDRIAFIRDLNCSCGIVVESGAIVDLTGNTYTSKVLQGSGLSGGRGVTFAPGGATVYPSAGSASAYVLGGVTVPQIGNTNVVTLGGSRVVASTGSITASNCVISGGAAMTGGKAAIFATSAGTTVNFTSTTVTGCTVTDSDSGGAFYITNGAVGTFTNCIFSGNADYRERGPTMTVEYGNAFAILSGCTATQTIQCGPYGTVRIVGGTVATLGNWGNATFVLEGAVKLTEVDNMWSTGNKVIISSGAALTLTHYIFYSGNPASIEVKTGGCTVNGHQIAAGNYTWIRQDGTFGQ